MYIVIAGGGKIGEYLASVLLSSGNDVAVIEENLATADRLSVALQGRYLVIHGDGCDSKYQEDASIRRATCSWPPPARTTTTLCRARSRSACSTCRAASRV